jgi:hypothetical protein
MMCLVSLGGVILAAMMFSGCEWSQSGSDNTWEDSMSWADFSGIYKSANPGQYLVAAYGVGTTNTAPIESCGTGDGTTLTFSSVLDHHPVVPGSVKITVATTAGLTVETFTDDGHGKLIGSKGSSGTIVYETGDVILIFLVAPAKGSTILATYTYSVGNAMGGSVAIYELTVTQMGNDLLFTDNDGSTYNGKITDLTTPTGGASNTVVSTTIMGNFTATGTCSSGQGVTIIGSFGGYFTTGGSLGSGYTISSRTVSGTWIEDSGKTGDLEGTAGGTANVTTTK